jgi:hypothetical protein
MNLKKLSLLLAPALLAGCFLTDSGENGDNIPSGSTQVTDENGNVNTVPSTKPSGAPMDVKVNMVLEEGLVIDETAQTITTVDSWSYCGEGGILEIEEDEYVENYTIEDGFLYVYDAEDGCYAEKFSGGFTSLVGNAWVFEGMTDLPAGVEQGSYCDYEEGMDSEMPFEVDYTMTIQNGKEIIDGTIKNYCPAEMLAAGIEKDFGTVIQEDCKTFTVKVGVEEMKVTISEFDMMNFAVAIDFTYNNKTCTMKDMGYSEITAAECSSAWAAYTADGGDGWFYASEWTEGGNSMMDFMSCMAENEFPMGDMTQEDESEEYAF